MSKGGIGSHTAPVRGATDSWITPQFVVNALGDFDLDPCQSCPQPWQIGARFYDVHQDGLSRPWSGRVWLNPPYSDVGRWMSRLADHGNGIALVFARTETKWFVESVWERAQAVMFLHGRLYFYRPDGTRGASNAGGPSCLVAYGATNSESLVMAARSGALRGTVLRIDHGIAEGDSNEH